MPATEPRLESLLCPHPGGQHRMAWWAWGPADAAHLVVCAHGLTRQGRDFDLLAQHLVARSGGRVQVLCPDVAGRGRSDWLAQPAHYHVGQYAADALALLAHQHARNPLATLDWVGTSMGGLMGMAVAVGLQQQLPSSPALPPIRRLVLNDVGPVLGWDAVQRMQAFVGRFGRYAHAAQAAQALREVSQGFGPVPDAVWLALSQHMVRPLPDGEVTLHYDPAIALPLRALTPELARSAQSLTWAMYDRIEAQVLLLRGMASDLLSEATALEMTRRGPQARLVQWPGVGHAPTLTDAAQMDAVASFLLGAAA